MGFGRIALEAKLTPPTPPAASVARPRLGALLEPPRPITLVCAPAGFGKTSATVEWLGSRGEPFGWLALDTGDNDAARFFIHLVAAIRHVAPGCGDAIAGAAADLRDADVPVLVERLVDELHRVRAPVVVALDDYHVIEEQRVHDVVGFVAEHLPPTMRLVMTSRREPPLPVSRWRVRGTVAELQQDDLRFTADETAMFLNRTMALGLTQEQIDTLAKRTEGWVGGIQLAALSLTRQDDRDAFLESFAGDDRYVMDYLTAEVLGAQPPEIRRFLLRTSILERMNAGLSAAVTGPGDCQAVLEQLERQHLFVVALDAKRGWYRYHHLFAGLLRHQLAASPDERASDCHAAASGWLEAHGFVAEAADHAFEASDFERVAELLERHGWDLMFGGRSKQVLGWVRRLPDRVLAAAPERVSIALWSQYFRTGRIEASWRAHLESTIRDDDAHAFAAELSLRDAIEAARAPRGYRTAIEHVRDLQADPTLTSRPLMGMFTGTILAGCAHATGDLETAERAYAERVDHALRDRHVTMYFVTAIGRVRLRAAMAGPSAGLRELDRALSSASEAGWAGLPFMSWLIYGRGELLLEQDELADAAAAFEETSRLAEHEPSTVRHLAVLGLARVRWAEGRVDDARDLVAGLALEPYVRPLMPVLPDFETERASLDAISGDPSAVRAFLEARSLFDGAVVTDATDAEVLVLGRWLVESRRYDDAAAVLTRRLSLAERSGNLETRVRVRLLLALARLGRGEWQEALQQLDAVLDAARPAGFRRVFLDAPAALTALLERRRDAGIDDEGRRRFVDDLLTGRSAKSPKAASAPRDPLSPTEQRVLDLLVEGLSNKEIASRLFVSPNTVKTHVRHVYGKLGARNRAEAIHAARARDVAKG